MGAGVMGFGGVEFFAEVGDDGVVGGVGLAEVLAHVFEEVFLMPSGKHGGGGGGDFAAVGDEFDGVDEVFAPGAKLLDALVEREMRCVGL